MAPDNNTYGIELIELEANNTSTTIGSTNPQLAVGKGEQDNSVEHRTIQDNQSEAEGQAMVTVWKPGIGDPVNVGKEDEPDTVTRKRRVSL